MSQALMDAMQANDVATLRSIIARQPHLVNFRDDQGDSPVLRAIYYGAHDAAQLLISEGAQLNVHEAAAVGDVVRVQDALSADPTALNSLSHDGWTPLHLASFFAHEDVARLLISRGADIHVVSTNRMENLPIHAAAANGKTAVVWLLLDHGADVNSRSRGWSPLDLAVENGNEELVALLLSRGADANARSGDGQSPLSRAAGNGNDGISDLLRQHGASE
ncbi:MAG: ankyrin repeat domain-containing protein [Chloroflexota bacterium]|nr:ankyrin repeat domain-containing protein [Chloroflexota bacterium]